MKKINKYNTIRELKISIFRILNKYKILRNILSIKCSKIQIRQDHQIFNKISQIINLKIIIAFFNKEMTLNSKIDPKKQKSLINLRIWIIKIKNNKP